MWRGSAVVVASPRRMVAGWCSAVSGSTGWSGGKSAVINTISVKDSEGEVAEPSRTPKTDVHSGGGVGGAVVHNTIRCGVAAERR